MDTPGSDNTTDSTETSTSDSSPAESPSAQIVTNLNESPGPPKTNDASMIDHDDSASDVSMSAVTDDEDEDGHNISTIQVNPDMHILEETDHLPAVESPVGSNKRKYLASMEDPTSNGSRLDGPPEELRKRLKSNVMNEKYRTPEGLLRQDKSLLPAEIWHHIFTFIPPRNLGLLLRVNRSFNHYLDPSSSNSSMIPLSKSAAQILQPDYIWQASRRLYRSGMPAPLEGKSELDMWRLACAFSCQFCGKERPNSISNHVWQPGPGETGVIPIYPFGVHACGPCLQERSSKEIELFLSSSVPSQLMAALPFIFLTNQNHVLPLTTIQNNQSPVGTEIAKVFFKPHVEDLQKEFTAVKDMGFATAEEWLKGLEDRGKERKNDAIRWEKWEASGGVIRMRNTQPNEREITLSTNSTPSMTTIDPGQTALATNEHTHAFNGHKTTYLPAHGLPTTPQIVQPVHTSFPTSIPRFDSPSQNGFAAYPPRSYPQARHERSKEEVAELKAARRAEIERRCMVLDPPLTPDVLAHMGSFQAAIQIIQPLNDGAWEVLKPRLLSQREDAEQREKERIAQTRVAQEQLKEYQDQQIKSESKEPYDRDWDIQAPLRARIGGYADETIRDGWAGGEKVSKDNCSAFAAEVLIYVRKRFYAEIAKDDAALRATCREPEIDPPEGPSSRKLTLENMKWVFDTKIKPHTEQYRKELFLCNDCEISKHYGFEGVIQHYAAKHTNALSMGSIVVHWKSEWPEYTPFNPEPASGKNSYYSAAQSASVPYASTAPQQPYYGGYQPAPASAPLQAPNLQGYQESPGPYYGRPQFGDQYSGQQNGPYAPPQPYQDSVHSYQAPQYSVPPPGVSSLGYSEPPQEYSQQGYGAQYPPVSQAYYNPPGQASQYPVSAPEISIQQNTYAPQSGQYGYPYSQPAAPPAPQTSQFTQAPPKTEEYKTQLLDVAKNARDVWDTINGLKDVPGSVKVQTIIFHVLKRSRFIFPEDPSLAMILDGLSSNKDMRKVRNVNGLLCRACSLGMAGSSSGPQKKHYSFPQLANHFHSVHEQGVFQNGHGHVPDWTQDMVELPDSSRLSAIAKAPGMTDQRLKLIAEAIPEIFAPPAQNLEFNDHQEQSTGHAQPEYGQPGDQDPYGPPPSKDNHDKYYTTVDSGRPSESGSVVYDSTQYDPRNPRDPREPQSPESSQPRYQVLRHADDYYPPSYPERRERSYVEPRVVSPRVRPSDGSTRVIMREEAPPMYLDEQPRYRDQSEVEYRVRRAPATIVYEDRFSTLPERDYRDTNSQAYQSNRHDLATQESQRREVRYLPAEDAATQQNHLFQVVAQISQQAKQARERPPQEEPAEGGSEDGELRAAPTSSPDINNRVQQSAEASNAAERFLNEFLPGDGAETSTKAAPEADMPPIRYENTHGEIIQQAYQPSGEPHRRLRDEYDQSERVVSARARPLGAAYDESIPNGYVVRDRSPLPRQTRAYEYEGRYVNAVSEQSAPRERSPELVDRRFKRNNVVYRDERQGSHGMHRTPSNRYARYESVRLENDRARSRSPVYVKMGPQPGQYSERSPGAHSSHQEPVYQKKTPHVSVEERTYERAPRQEYYRVYADDHRPNQPQYVETYEYVQVSDPQGDYMIRRPIRQEREPVYATYEGDQYSRKPVYESRAPVSRPEPSHYEEYDPRHPAPPPAAAPIRQVRYQ